MISNQNSLELQEQRGYERNLSAAKESTSGSRLLFVASQSFKTENLGLKTDSSSKEKDV